MKRRITMSINLIATTTFGLEAVVKRECQALGFENIKTSDGKVEFTGTEADIVKANMWLRCAGRVWVKMGTFKAVTFTELFDQTKALPWADWIPEDGKFTVVGKSVKSTLFSVSDCQAIVKKAVVEKLKQTYHTDWFDETGASYTIQVGILKDVVTLAIDTSGSGLHMRGYRANALDAPLKETLASAMIQLSYWRKNRILLDPFCGSGTIPIEAAMIARNIAPGIHRKFASEEWERIGKDLWKKARVEAYQAIDYDVMPEIYGSDIDPDAIELAKEAGLQICLDMASYNIVANDMEFFSLLINKYVDIVFANEEEAKAFTGKEPKEALGVIAKKCSIAIVKVGAEGSYIRKGTEEIKVSAIPVEKVVDTTGAGDYFASGFLYGLTCGYSLEKCAKIGSILSGNVIQVIGTSMPQERWDEIKLNINRILAE